MRGASSLRLVTDNTNASTLRSRKLRKARRAAASADRPAREALVLDAARALVASAARDDWREARARAEEICAIYNPDKDPPIPGIEVLLRSLAWISDGAWGEPADDFGDASELLLESSFSPDTNEPATDGPGADDSPCETPRRQRIDDAQRLLYLALVDRSPTSFDAAYLHVLTLAEGMRPRLQPPLIVDDSAKPFQREATTFVRRFSRELGGGPEAERMAWAVVANCLEYPGQKIGIPERRRLNHPLSAIVLTDEAWAALRRACLGGNGRNGSSELVAPSAGGSGRLALERAFERVAEFPEVFAYCAKDSIASVARELQVTPANARVLVRAWTPARVAFALSRARADAPLLRFWLAPRPFGFGDERDELATASVINDSEDDEIPF